ncbi:hypothetical protein GU926_07670 [Nibribacter ruber]|uniref:Uncharacterized protein n=1 Tax=Nibribacter ruber TaxID=2698458 RepID=A0A6P1NTW9_9BACT|nr:hypothetical protein [Nibribacter ruber]QHL87316.1 hypothetical protein GU926_07670 [Nibribacter ruber]
MIVKKESWLFLMILLSAIFPSCKSKVEHHKNLIYFDQEHFRDLTEKEFEDYTSGRRKFKKEIIEKQNGDTLYITVDFPWDGCASMFGDLAYRKDSLILLYGLKEDVLCTEVIYYRLSYKVLNTAKTAYKLGFRYKEGKR